MAGRLAMLACGGALPVEIYRATPDLLVYTLEGIPSAVEGESHKLEKIGGLMGAMRAAGVEKLVFAGGLTRPALSPAEFDGTMAQLAPRVMQAMNLGDDGLLRSVIAFFEEQGFAVVGAHEVCPALVAEAGLAVGPDPDEAETRDIARAGEILRGISALDIGQGCVVAGGQCLGIETVQGTDWLLQNVGATDRKYFRDFKGVYAKAAKDGQDLRIDMPTIGPKTVAAVAGAGLAGMVLEAGRVLILEREATLSAARDAGIFLRTESL
jgi:DUF1009 family protein